MPINDARYIAFEGSSNEQVYNAETRTITWTRHPELKIEDIDVVLVTEDGGLTEWRLSTDD